MNKNIPKDIQLIIYRYIHNLYMKDIKKELKQYKKRMNLYNKYTKSIIDYLPTFLLYYIL
jgi:adenylate kinase family enzyme